MASFDTEAVKARAVAAYRAFTPAQLVIAAGLSVLSLIGVMYFASWASKPSYAVLFAGLQPKDAAAVTAKLQADGVAYQLVAGGTTIEVPSASLDKERLALSAAGVPASSGDGWAVLDKQGLTSSPFQQQVAYQRALEAEISNTLSTMTGVSGAQVHLVMPQQSVFATDQQPARASVMLTTNGAFSASAAQSVMQLVASAVPNLDAGAVTVTDSTGKLLSHSGGPTSDDAKAAYEDSATTAAQTMLDSLLGTGHAVVRVTADVDMSNQTVTSDTYDPKSSVPVAQQSTQESYASATSGSGTGGALTTTTTTGTVPNPSPSAGYSSSGSSTSSVVNHVQTHSTVPAGALKRLSIAVAVDSSAKNLPPTAQLQQLVAAAVGAQPARGDTVVVTSAAFDPTTVAAAAGTKAKTTASGSSSMIPTGVGILILLVVMGMLARVVRRPSVTALALPELSAAPVAYKALPSGASRPELSAGSRPALEAPGGASSLLDAVEHQPDDVAALLKNWLADAGSSR